MTHIMVGIPSYDRTIHTGLLDALLNESVSGGPPFDVTTKSSSLLAHGCNVLWCSALNGREKITHFMMLHADVIPIGVGFIGEMFSLMEIFGADILSVALPIKTAQGFTSTAFVSDGDALDVGLGRAQRRRITMKELAELPDTFSAQEVSELYGASATNPQLLINTGMMLVDMSGDWVERVRFEINDTIYQNSNGRYVADVEPEDWFFSRQAHEAGARICVTSKIKAHHAGRGMFPNWGAWGTTAHDIPQVSQNGSVENEVKSKESV